MKIYKQYNGTIIGGVFTIICLLLTFTIIIPIFSVLPGAYIEIIVSALVYNEPYSNVGLGTLIVFLLILSVSLTIILIISRKIEFSNWQILEIMTFEYFIIHSLGFYIYWASLNFRGDGQVIFGAVTSFPVSSFGFVGIGLLIDLIKIKPSSQSKQF